MNKIIDQEKIYSLLEAKADESKVNDILNKALALKGLNLEEAATLLNVEDEKVLDKLFHAAKALKEKVYGKRIVLFAPLYASNYCNNNCVYCAFRHDNQVIKRVHLTPEQVVEEAKAIMKLGHKRIIILTGEEHKMAGLDYIGEIMERIYSEKAFKGEIRRINVNLAPYSIEDFKKLKSFDIGTYQLFQETYDRTVYKDVHPSGKKADYDWRLEAMDRAMEAGIADVGIGPLFGLANYKFETLATLMHSKHLEEKFGCGPHTISVPRIEHAQGVAFSDNPPENMSEIEFKKIVAVIRLAVPYTGLVLSTRETPELRRELLELGISQISAESKVNPGGYELDKTSAEQFQMSDNRHVAEVVMDLVKHGFIPSFCTSCYRKGRVGKDFMEFAKPGLIHRFCNTNALLTFKEYLDDYAPQELKVAGNKLIEREVENLDDDNLKNEAKKCIKMVESGQRDVYI